MRKAINLERPDGTRIQVNVEDIQFIEEGTDGKTNVMIRHYGQVTASSSFDDVMGWLDGLLGRQRYTAVRVNDEDEAHETSVSSVDDARENGTEASRAVAKKMMKPKKPRLADDPKKPRAAKKDEGDGSQN